MFKLNEQLAHQRLHAREPQGVRRRSHQIAWLGRRTEDRRLSR